MSCEACRTLPPVVPKGYATKGSYEVIAGLNTYVTGSSDSGIGIIDIYDIFGLASQTLQGADLLASRLDALVLVPDFFHGEAASHEWTPPNTEEKRALFKQFMAEKAAFPQNVDALLALANTCQTQFPSVKSWGTFGLCWGGKVAVLASGPGTPFAASGQVHPGRLDKADAEKLKIPHIVLASKDEAADVVAGYAEVIGTNGIGGHVETYSTMWHGWLGARANLEEEDSRAEYTRGYSQLADFFEKYLLQNGD